MFKKNSKGITLIESFLAAFIFVIGAAAIFTTLFSWRKPAMNNDQAVGAALALRNVLEDLRAKIKTGDATAGQLLEPGSHGPITVGSYNVMYGVAEDSITHVRQVDANVVWTDAM